MLKRFAAGERVDLLDDYDFAARTIPETTKKLCERKGMERKMEARNRDPEWYLFEGDKNEEGKKN